MDDVTAQQAIAEIAARYREAPSGMPLPAECARETPATTTPLAEIAPTAMKAERIDEDGTHWAVLPPYLGDAGDEA